MSGDEFVFRGQTTFINRPSRTVVQNFQNTYLRGDGSTADRINAEFTKLGELCLGSRELPEGDKEEVVGAIHAVAEQVRDDKSNRLTLQGTLQAIETIVSRAADVADPALAIITTIMALAGLT